MVGAQSEGYLEAHLKSNVSSSQAGLEGATPAQRTLAMALGHLLPPARAVAVATKHSSVAALMRALTAPGLTARQREEALVMQSTRSGTTVGKASSKLVHDFLTQRDPQATCRPEAGGNNN